MMPGDSILLIVCWIFLTVVLGLSPLLFAIIFNLLIDSSITWIQILKEGELFLFSTTISANGISKLLLPTPNEANAMGTISLIQSELSTGKLFTIIGLVSILVFSACMFGTLSLIKLNNSSNTFQIKERNYAIAAVGCAIIAIGFSYSAFTQGGMK